MKRSFVFCFLFLSLSISIWAKDPQPAQDLLKRATALQSVASSYTEASEKECYWKPKSPKTQDCMQKQVSFYNQEAGAGSFVFDPQLNVIRYTGLHFQQILDQYPGTSAAAEADYFLLTKQLVGHPDVVLPRVKNYLQRNPEEKWQSKGLLLWARLNEDAWWIHRKWSWVLYNGEVSPEELIVKSEPYRQEALRTFERIVKEFKKFPESKPAKQELKLLKEYKTDGVLYGIMNETRK